MWPIKEGDNCINEEFDRLRIVVVFANHVNRETPLTINEETITTTATGETQTIITTTIGTPQQQARGKLSKKLSKSELQQSKSKLSKQASGKITKRADLWSTCFCRTRWLSWKNVPSRMRTWRKKIWRTI